MREREMHSADESGITRSEFLTRLVAAVGIGLTRPLSAARWMGGGAHRAADGARARRGLPHPEPRDGITGEHVLPAEQLGANADILAAYAAARAYPEIFDGLYCACRCRDSHHHRSLLSCYESR